MSVEVTINHDGDPDYPRDAAAYFRRAGVAGGRARGARRGEDYAQLSRQLAASLVRELGAAAPGP